MFLCRGGGQPCNSSTRASIWLQADSFELKPGMGGIMGQRSPTRGGHDVDGRNQQFLVTSSDEELPCACPPSKARIVDLKLMCSGLSKAESPHLADMIPSARKVVRGLPSSSLVLRTISDAPSPFDGQSQHRTLKPASESSGKLSSPALFGVACQGRMYAMPLCQVSSQPISHMQQ